MTWVFVLRGAAIAVAGDSPGDGRDAAAEATHCRFAAGQDVSSAPHAAGLREILVG